MSGGTLPRIGMLDTVARQNNIPVNVLFELTHRCNLRCFHCYVIPEEDRELSTDEVKDVLGQLADAGTLFVTFTGGEIMVRRDLFEIIEHARKLHFAVRLFTNGTLIDEEAADRIADAHPVDVGISMYGASAKTHETVTLKPGSFDASLRALRLLNERGVFTHMKCVLMAENTAERAAIADLADEVGARIQFDPQLTPRNDGDRSALEHSMDEKSLSDIVRIQQLLGRIDADSPLCAAGRDAATISPSGRVLPCVQWPVSLGSLREESFERLWSGVNATEIRSLTMSRLDTCTSCSDLGYCSPCLGLNFIETGDATQPSSSVCQMAHARREGANE